MRNGSHAWARSSGLFPHSFLHTCRCPIFMLSQIHPSTSHLTVLDLKDDFFTILLHPDWLDIFAFTSKDPDTGTESQLTRTGLQIMYLGFLLSVNSWKLTLNHRQFLQSLIPPLPSRKRFFPSWNWWLILKPGFSISVFWLALSFKQPMVLQLRPLTWLSLSYLPSFVCEMNAHWPLLWRS